MRVEAEAADTDELAEHGLPRALAHAAAISVEGLRELASERPSNSPSTSLALGDAVARCLGPARAVQRAVQTTSPPRARARRRGSIYSGRAIMSWAGSERLAELDYGSPRRARRMSSWTRRLGAVTSEASQASRVSQELRLALSRAG